MPRGFARWLVVLVAAGLAARLAYVLVVMHGVGVSGDGLEFHLLANQLANGDGYIEPLIVAPAHIATADKPPLYPLLLALPSWVGWDTVTTHRVASCLMGATLVAGVGLLGRRVAGERVGLLAAAIAAFYPALVTLDGSLRSESLYAPLIAFALLAAYRVVDRPSKGRAAMLGAVVGLAALTRSEALLLLLLLVVPVVLLVPRALRGRTLAIAVVACAVVLSPWVIRNWTTFGGPLLSTNAGSLVYGANCQTAYYSRLIGTWSCFPPLRASLRTSEARLSARLRRRGLDFASGHSGRVPAVVGVRLLRTWDFWSPRDATRLEAAIADRDLATYRAGVLVYWLLLPLAIAGAVLLRRRRAPLRVLLAPLALTVIVTVLGYGTTRFRVPADIAIAVLAAASLAAIADALLARVRPRACAAEAA